jgi:hypothetical protein
MGCTEWRAGITGNRLLTQKPSAAAVSGVDKKRGGVGGESDVVSRNLEQLRLSGEEVVVGSLRMADASRDVDFRCRCATKDSGLFLEPEPEL